MPLDLSSVHPRQRPRPLAVRLRERGGDPVPGHDAEEFGGELYNELLALTESSWSRWNHALEHVPSESLSTPGVCGIWSVKDLIGHIAVWDDVAVQKIGRLAGGEGPHAD